MKFESIINKKKEINLLNTKLNKLAKEFKEEIRDKESDGYKISIPTQNTLYHLLHSIESLEAFNIINREKSSFLITMPDYYERQNEISEPIYHSMINTISNRINDKNYYYIFDSTNSNGDFDIFECISNLDNISERYMGNIDCDIRILLTIIRTSNNKLKVKTALNLLHDINEIGDYELESKLIDALKNFSNENKIKELYTITKIVPFNNDDNINKYVEKLLEYILIEKSEEYDKNLNEIISKVFRNEVLNKIKYEDNNIIDFILKTNLENSNNKNMKIILNLLDSDIITTNYTDSLKFMINNTLKMNFACEEHKKVYIKILNNIVFKSDNTQIRDYFIKKLNETSSIKSMKALLDLYPFIKEYCEGAEKQIFEQLCDIENTSNKQFKSDILKKKLIIPVNYKTEE